MANRLFINYRRGWERGRKKGSGRDGGEREHMYIRVKASGDVKEPGKGPDVIGHESVRDPLGNNCDATPRSSLTVTL